MSKMRLLVSAAALKWVITPAAVLASAAVVWTASNAAFTATTDNSANTWSAAGVSLTDDDSGTTMFTVSNLKPGQTGNRCIVVTYGGSIAANVKLYTPTATLTTTNSLSSYIDLTIDEAAAGTNATFAGSTGGCTLTSATNIYTGTLANMSTRATYGTGLSNWSPTGSGQTRIYKITYTMNASAPDSTQSGTAGARFVWEAQNS